MIYFLRRGSTTRNQWLARSIHRLCDVEILIFPLVWIEWISLTTYRTKQVGRVKAERNHYIAAGPTETWWCKWIMILETECGGVWYLFDLLTILFYPSYELKTCEPKNSLQTHFTSETPRSYTIAETKQKAKLRSSNTTYFPSNFPATPPKSHQLFTIS